MKRYFVFVLLLVSVVLSSTVMAAEQPMVKNYEFEATDKSQTYTFDEAIKENGVEYALENTTYEVVSETVGKKTVEKIVDLGGYLNQEANAEQTMEIDGVTYTIKEIKYSEGVVDDRSGSYSHQVEYESVISEPKVPQRRSVTFTDEATGKLVTTTVNLDDVKQTSDYAWKNDVEIIAKALPYNALYYAIGDVQIPHNEDHPEIEGKEAVVLEQLDLPSESYRIDRAEWKGEEQTDENGIQYREAIIYGSRLVADFVAEYSATGISLPAADGYEAVATYTAEVEDPDNTTYLIRATATYTPTGSPSLPVAVGTTATVACAAFILFWFTKRNVLVHQNGKPIYKTRVRKNTVVIPDRLVYSRNPGQDLMVTIKKGYTKHHIGEPITIVSNRLPTVDTVIEVAADMNICVKKRDFLK